VEEARIVISNLNADGEVGHTLVRLQIEWLNVTLDEGGIWHGTPLFFDLPILFSNRALRYHLVLSMYIFFKTQ